LTATKKLPHRRGIQFGVDFGASSIDRSIDRYRNPVLLNVSFP
jgi:hypothetical protein